MSISVYFETDTYFHLLAVESEDELERVIFKELNQYYTEGDNSLRVYGPQKGYIFVESSDNTSTDNKALQEKVLGIINKFKGENEGV